MESEIYNEIADTISRHKNRDIDIINWLENCQYKENYDYKNECTRKEMAG